MATSARSYQYPWPTLLQEGGQQAVVPPEAAATTATAAAAAEEIKNQRPRWAPREDLHECGSAMKHNFPPCLFRTGGTCGPLWEGPSSLPCMVAFFVRTGICAGCAGRTVSVQTCMSPPPQRWQPPSPGYLKCLGGNYRGSCSLASAGRISPPPPRT